MGLRPTRRTDGSSWSASKTTAVNSVSSSRPRTATGSPICAFTRDVTRPMTDELGERISLIVDGAHGRVHHVALHAPKDLVAGLERQEVERLGKSLEGHAGKYALIENAHEFTLIPWRPVMDERLGRKISGIVWESGISWDFERKRALGIGT
jgi:hypothetical protein